MTRARTMLSICLLSSLPGIGGCGGCGSEKSAQADAGAAAAAAGTSSSSRTIDRAQAPQLDVMGFIKEFTEDSAAANIKYTGHIFKVVGSVHELSGDRLVLHDRQGAVSCMLPPGQAAGLAVGQSVTVTGVVTPGDGHIAVNLRMCERAP